MEHKVQLVSTFYILETDSPPNKCLPGNKLTASTCSTERRSALSNGEHDKTGFRRWLRAEKAARIKLHIVQGKQKCWMCLRNVVTTVEDRPKKKKKVTEFLPDNVGVILKRDVNTCTSAVDKDKHVSCLKRRACHWNVTYLALGGRRGQQCRRSGMQDWGIFQKKLFRNGHTT